MQAYVVNVAWSDGVTVTIYRRYSTFYELHVSSCVLSFDILPFFQQIQLMDEFPIESGMDGGSRTLPYLPGSNVSWPDPTFMVNNTFFR
jgi:hypothetical protein